MPDDAPPDGWRVGEVARLAGLTVRTLHHYDDIGLLRPDRTPAGHRVYRHAHVERLYRICVLRRFGRPLEEIAHALEDPTWTLDGALRTHLRALDEETLRIGRVVHRLGDALVAQGTGTDGLHSLLLAALEDAGTPPTAPLRRIAVLVYEDLERAHDHLVRVFGLEPGPIRRDEDGAVVQAEVRTVDGRVMLHRVAPEWRLASPTSLGGVATGMLVVTVPDVDAHHAGVLARGGSISFPPTDQSYGVREYGALGPEGEPWSFWTPLPE